MIPTGRLMALALVPVALALVAVAWRPALGLVAVADVALLVVAVGDWLLSRDEVAVERRTAPVWSVGEPTPVTLRLHNPGRRALDLLVADEGPAPSEELPAVVRLHPDEAVELTWRCRMDRRGLHRFRDVVIRARTPLGLFWRQARYAAAMSVRVYPDFRHLRTYGLAARLDERRAPVRARRRPGGESEFERLRPYLPGDPYRHIDWKASARQDRFVVREFGQEANQHVTLLLDAGRLTGARMGELSAFDHGLHAALALAQVALRHGDRVGLVAYDQEVRAWVPPRGGARHNDALLQATYDLFPSELEADVTVALRHLSARVRRRSLVVLVTALGDEVTADTVAAVVRAMGGRHLPLVVTLRDPSLHALAHGPAPTEVAWFERAAAHAQLAWREAALQRMRDAGALALEVAAADLTPAVLGQYLEIKARRLL